MTSAREYPEFITITCLEWKPVLDDNRFKDIIIDSLRFLVKAERITVYSFVIMSNHFHLIWQIMGNHGREAVQRDFLRFTAQQILKFLRNEQAEMLNLLLVNANDRKYQVWERKSLSISLVSPAFFDQKLDYIHRNPVTAGLTKYPEEYKYSSARFYFTGVREWDFLTHYDG